jgi:hypothetical protein
MGKLAKKEGGNALISGSSSNSDRKMRRNLSVSVADKRVVDMIDG